MPTDFESRSAVSEIRRKYFNHDSVLNYESLEIISVAKSKRRKNFARFCSNFTASCPDFRDQIVGTIVHTFANKKLLPCPYLGDPVRYFMSRILQIIIWS